LVGRGYPTYVACGASAPALHDRSLDTDVTRRLQRPFRANDQVETGAAVRPHYINPGSGDAPFGLTPSSGALAAGFVRATGHRDQARMISGDVRHKEG